MSKVSVILPTYNERENIGDLINAILENVEDLAEIIVVDDNSPDGTWKVVKKIGSGNEKVKLLRRTNVRGLASAISDGVSLSKGDKIVWMDCDFSHPPELIPQLVEALDDCDIACASRFVKGGGMRYSFIRVLVSRLINLFANIFLGFSVRDYTTGFLAVRRRVFEKINISGEYGEYCIDFLYRSKKHGFRIREIPYVYLPRKVGETKTATNLFNLLKRGMIYCSMVVKLSLE